VAHGYVGALRAGGLGAVEKAGGAAFVGVARGRGQAPFAGSGSTLVAAQHMGATAIGIEKEAEYVVIAKSRLQP